MKKRSGLICLGAIAGAHGVRGEVRLKSFCAVPEDVSAYGPLVTEDGQSFDVRLKQPIKGGFVARLSGLANKEQADALKGTRLYVARDQLPPAEDDEFYHSDLLGLTVQDASGAPLGRVKAVQNYGASDLLEVQPKSGESYLIPFTAENIPEVNLSLGIIVAHLPESEAD